MSAWKDLLERSREELPESDRQRLWRRIRGSTLSPEPQRRSTPARRWTISFGLAATLAVVAGVLIMESRMAEERAGRSRPVTIGGPLEVRPQLAALVTVPDGSTLPDAEAGSAPPSPTGARAGGFASPLDAPISSFSFDARGPSYDEVRRSVGEGRLPPGDRVRVEELVNSFDQGYADFASPDFRLYVDGAPSPFRDGFVLLRVGAKARGVVPGDRPPVDLVFVVDVSRSMARGDRLGLIRRSLALLTGRLTPGGDRVGIVAYGQTGRMLLEPTDVRDREAILRAIDRLEGAGDPNAANGLELGYAMARYASRPGAERRVVLCSAGTANVPGDRAAAALARAAAEAQNGISLTAIGFGMGNYDDTLMRQLAREGRGVYLRVDDPRAIEQTFLPRLLPGPRPVARDARILVAFDPRRVERYRLLGFTDRERARDDRTDEGAGGVAAGSEAVALYEVRLSPESSAGEIASVRLRYERPEGGPGAGPGVLEVSQSCGFREIAGTFDAASPRLRLDAAVAQFAEILRDGGRTGWAGLGSLLPLSRRLAAELAEDAAAGEFARLVERAAGIAGVSAQR